MKCACIYCNHIFSTKANLNNHQKTAKYCLKLQNKCLEDKYKCDGCDKIFSTNHHLERHERSCRSSNRIVLLSDENNELKENIRDLDKKIYEKDIIIEQKDNQLSKYENQLSKYENTIKELQDKLENIAIKATQRPTTTNTTIINNRTNVNNFIQNMQPVTRDYLVEQSDNLTLEHIQNGASGYAKYAIEYPFKDRIACVDYSRRKIKFKDNNGNLISDLEMIKLAPMFFDRIKVVK